MARLSILLLIVLHGLAIAVRNDGTSRKKRLNSKIMSHMSGPVENNVGEFKVKKEEFEKLSLKVIEISQKYDDLKFDLDRRIIKLENRSKRLLNFLMSTLKEKKDRLNDNRPSPVPYVIKRGGREPISFNRNIIKVQPLNLDPPRNKRHEGALPPGLSNDYDMMARTEPQNLQLHRSDPLSAADSDASATTSALSANPEAKITKNGISITRITTRYTILDLFQGLFSPLTSLWTRLGF